MFSLSCYQVFVDCVSVFQTVRLHVGDVKLPKIEKLSEKLDQLLEKEEEFIAAQDLLMGDDEAAEVFVNVQQWHVAIDMLKSVLECFHASASDDTIDADLLEAAVLSHRVGLLAETWIPSSKDLFGHGA